MYRARAQGVKRLTRKDGAQDPIISPLVGNPGGEVSGSSRHLDVPDSPGKLLRGI